MNSFSTIGLISSIALILPLLMIIAFRLCTYKSFPALFVYFLSISLYNIARTQFPDIDPQILVFWSSANNFADAPLILFFLTYFSTLPSFKKKMYLLIAGIIFFQLIVIFSFGFTTKAVSIFLAPGIISVFAFSLYFFVRHTKISITHYKAVGKAVISASLLFAYGCYAIIYLVYYVLKLPAINDTFLLYYIVVTISSISMAIGIAGESKRVRKLKELLQTRKELSVIYNNEAPTARSIRTLALDFDKDPWV